MANVLAAWLHERTRPLSFSARKSHSAVAYLLGAATVCDAVRFYIGRSMNEATKEVTDQTPNILSILCSHCGGGVAHSARSHANPNVTATFTSTTTHNTPPTKNAVFAETCHENTEPPSKHQSQCDCEENCPSHKTLRLRSEIIIHTSLTFPRFIVISHTNLTRHASTQSSLQKLHPM